MRTHLLPATLLLAAAAVLAGCQTPKGESIEEKRDYVRNMRDETLAELYAQEPRARADVENAAGYAAFSNLGTQFLFTRSGHGYGLAVDRDGEETFMRMGEVGAGIGLKVSEFRAVFVFRSEEAFDRFVEKGWVFGAEADASAKTEKGGTDNEGAGSFENDIRIYRFKKRGISLQTAVTGSKYWKDKDLNG